MKEHNYFIYILTNKNKNVLYTGVTNNLTRRLSEHYSGKSKTSFTNKYNCYYLVDFEHYSQINLAIKREKEIKGWNREKKNKLIEEQNPEWRFLNEEVKEQSSKEFIQAF